ncbi:MAG: DUF1015 domain-containing protein [Nocardiopsaceae bacterium]|nr:DUF1015 domain-containing protein [Nocardiopsaceae bacterium]
MTPARAFSHCVVTLPSAGPPGPSGPRPGLELKPFRGIRYDPDRVGDIASITSPPYDVIGPGGLAALLGASPYNSVRLILPGSETGGPPDPSAAGALAGRRLGEWLGSGALVRDPRPALYVYEQNGSGLLQRGLVGLVGVGEPSASGIFPHEGVMPGPVAGRRTLMLQTRANLEPIFLVYEGASKLAASRLADRTAEESAPLAEAVTGDGITHRLWRVTDPAAHAAVAADLAGRGALIADGHHRYAAYRELREEMRAAGRGAGPWDYGLAFLVDADAYPPRLGAIHRVIPGLPAATAATRAATAFTVTELPGDFGAAMAALADAGQSDGHGDGGEGRHGGHAFVLAGPDGYWLLTRPDRERLAAAMPAGTSPRWRSLDSAVLGELLLADLWGISDNERDVLISHDAEEAARMARSSSGTAVLCNPVPFGAVRDIAAGGERVPRKSTSFGPKPRTGLVFRTFDE